MSVDLCEWELNQPTVEGNTRNTAVWMMFTMQCVMIFHFGKNLMGESHNINSLNTKDPLTTSVLSYLSMVTLFLLIYFYGVTVYPLFQSRTKSTLIQCQTQWLLGSSCSSLCYAIILEIFLIRLRGAFKDSIYQVSALVNNSFRVVLISLCLFQLTIYLIYTIHNDCFIKVPSGFFGQSPEYSLVCTSSDSRYRDLFVGSAVLGIIVIPLCNVCLMYMFVTRLRSLSQSGNTDVFTPLIEKIFVLCIVGISSTIVSCLALIIFTRAWLVAIDMLFNEVILFMMFKFGDDWYHWVFDGLVRWVKARLDIEDTPTHMARVASIGSVTSVSEN